MSFIEKYLPVLKGLTIHLAAAILLFVIIVWYFFSGYLPSETNHGESITVPDLIGMPSQGLDEFLANKNLRYTINDSSSFDPNIGAGAVVNQHPKADSKVKENRNIYISINSSKPPMVNFPELHSVTDAQVKLKSYGIFIDSIKYVPDLAKNHVLKQLYKGKEIQQGDPIPKGAQITLIVGDGLADSEIPVPDFTGMMAENMEGVLRGAGLNLGSLFYVEESEMEDGVVLRQRPIASDSTDVEINKIQIGGMVDLWISGEQPIDSTDSK